MPKIVIDGVEIEAKEGQTVLQAAKSNGIHIPHFCYHPRLKIAGNCRMCLVEIEKVPKLQIACGTPVRDGMVVSTQCEKVQRARRAVVEFLLINHPLDCPVCDQCGECKLQDYCFEYGVSKSRFSEEKHKFEDLDLGPKLSRDQHRCIHCTRCIRFLRDVAGSEEAALTERGGHTVVGPYVSTPIKSSFALNAADVCPVGALTSKPFRFKARSWLMEKTRTVCPDCSRGCNVIAWASKGKILRLTPASNDYVNLSWLCDEGRLSSTGAANGEGRLLSAKVKGRDDSLEAAFDVVVRELRPLLESDSKNKIGVLGSASLTNEDNFCVAKLANDVLQTSMVSFLAGAEDSREFIIPEEPLTEWFIREDKFSNSCGARDIYEGAAKAVEPMAFFKAMAEGEIKALLVFGADPVTLLPADADVKSALHKLGFIFVAESSDTGLSELAQVRVPEATHFEKEGTFTNEARRVQKFSQAIPSLGESRPAWQIASELAKRLGAPWKFNSAADVFEAMAKVVPDYNGLTLSAIPDDGVGLGEDSTKSETETAKEG